jgi:hypothetical protein
MISAAQPGNTVDLKVLRDGKPVEVSVKIGDRAEIVADNGSGKESAEGGRGRNHACAPGRQRPEPD